MKPITILSAKPVDKKMINKMIKPKITPLNEKKVKCVKANFLNKNAKYYYPEKDVKNSLKNLKAELEREISIYLNGKVNFMKRERIGFLIDKAFEKHAGELK